MHEEFLRAVPLFADLTDDDLELLCAGAGELRLGAGETLFEEGTLADRAFVLRTGELVIVKRVGDRDVEIDRHDEPGTVIGEMALLDETTRLASVRATRESELVVLGHSQVAALLHTSPTAAQGMLRTLTRRWRSLEEHVRHDERMAQLGTLTAGLAHELNNPASALVRDTPALRTAMDRALAARTALERVELSAPQQRLVEELESRTRAATATPDVTALDRAEREEALEERLAALGVGRAWEAAAPLVALDLDRGVLDDVAEAFGTERLPTLVAWLAAAASVHTLLEEIALASGRVSTIVAALKSYTYLDQAPVQEVDVHRGLDDTIFFLGGKLGRGVVVERDYDPDLPKVTAGGGELNQVWTTLVDNAVDAVGGSGRIVVRTRAAGDRVVVEVQDDGPGIPEDHLPRLFDPFFTTKPPGSGAGLGLAVTYQVVRELGGQIGVSSVPGRTVVRVELPVNPAI